MASKSLQHEPEKAEVIVELLEHCESSLDRVKVLYEQFFLGIQKQPPTHLHSDVERKLRELQQQQIRNTALRYRFATVQQKFGSYNNYWRRTLRQIESGTYHRNLAKIGRQAAMSGEDIPDEILAAMPKRMREQVKRDRDVALSQKRRRDEAAGEGDFLEEAATGTAPPAPRVTTGGAHVVEDDGEFDLDAYFRAVTNDDSPSEETRPDAKAYAAAAAAPPAPPAPVRAAVGLRTPPAGVPAAPRVTPPGRQSQPMAAQAPPSMQDSQAIPTQAIPTIRPSRPAVPQDTQVIPTQALPTLRPDMPPPRPAMGLPSIPSPGQLGPNRPVAPSQVARPLSVMPGAASSRGAVAVETLAGPFPREQPRPATPVGGAPAPRPGPPPPPGGKTQAIPRAPIDPATQAIPRPPLPGQTQAMPRPGTPPPMHQTQAMPRPPLPGQTQAMPRPPVPGQATQAIPRPPPPGQTQAMPRTTQPIDRATQPIKPTRTATEPGVGAPAGRVSPPPGMTDADVNALYAKYVKAKEAVGEKAGPGAYGKLLQTINAQAPKIMEQYKAKGVEFQVVVKDNHVVIRAKPKP